MLDLWEGQFRTDRTVLCLVLFLYSNNGLIRHDPYWTSGKNNLELIELSSINKVNLV